MSVAKNTFKAIVAASPNPRGTAHLQLTSVPTPTPVSGQALVHVLFAYVSPVLSQIVNGNIPLVRNWPLTPGDTCIGRIEAVGPDAVALAPGQLVVVDGALHGRDDPDQKAVLGLLDGQNPIAEKLSKDGWRNGTMAEKVLVPLESITIVDEEVLVKERGMSIERIFWANRFPLPYEGYKLAKLTPGDTVIVAWATGSYGNATAELALALGAGRVIVLGRDMSKLEAWAKPLPPHLRSRVHLFTPTNDTDADTASLLALTPGGKGANIFFDFSPTAISWSPQGAIHIKACIGALAQKGRVVFMGVIRGDVAIPYSTMVRKDISLFSSFMYEPDTPRKVFRMLETGLLDVSEERGYSYQVVEGLDKFEEAMAAASASKDTRFAVLLKP